MLQQGLARASSSLEDNLLAPWVASLVDLREPSDALMQCCASAPPWAPTSAAPWLTGRCDASLVDSHRADLRRCSVEARLQLAQLSGSTMDLESEIPLTLEKYEAAKASCGGTKISMRVEGRQFLPGNSLQLPVVPYILSSEMLFLCVTASATLHFSNRNAAWDNSTFNSYKMGVVPSRLSVFELRADIS